MTACPVVVIGHVDHGKTSLVRALTGTDTDRLPEEKRRGLSIELGFAFHQFPDGVIDFIDAPGHQDFIHAMSSGASGAQGALVVIDANSGPQAQTIEHLKIAQLLGIRHWIVVATKADLVPESRREQAMATLSAGLASTPVENTRPILCSAKTGEGLRDVASALQGLLSAEHVRTAPRCAFLPVDRVFSLTGVGTIVTGTLLGGSLQIGDSVVTVPRGLPAKVRGLQSRGVGKDRIGPGERAAVNLRGVASGDIVRGDAIAAAGVFEPGARIDTLVSVSPDAPAGLKQGDSLRLLLGTASHVIRVRIFKSRRLAPGETGFAQLEAPNLIAAFAGQRGILRCLSPAATLGSCTVIDTLAPRLNNRAPNRIDVLEAAGAADLGALGSALVSVGRGAAALPDLARLSGYSPAEIASALPPGLIQIGPGEFTDTASMTAARVMLQAGIATYQAEHPDYAAVPLETVRRLSTPAVSPKLWQTSLDALIASGALVKVRSGYSLPGHNPREHCTDAQIRDLAAAEATLEAEGLGTTRSTNDSGDRRNTALFQTLANMGRILALWNVSLRQTVWLHPDAVRRAASTLASEFPFPAYFTTSQARQSLATSRKIIIPLLEHFDAAGLTLRTGDTRQVVNANATV